MADVVRIVRQDCGSCHGMRLTGGLGPPLTAQALADRPLEAIVAFGWMPASSMTMPEMMIPKLPIAFAASDAAA